MNFKRIVLIFVFIGILSSCKKDDENNPVAVPPRLLADQTTEDDAAIKEYLETHFYNYEEFENQPDGFDFKIRIDTIAGENADRRSLMTDISSETITVSSTAFGLNVEENDIAHTLYYLNTDTGGGVAPTALDSVYLRYEGTGLDNTVFDSNTGTPVWFDLPGALSQFNPGTITGFKRGLPKFRSGSDITINDDGTFSVNNFGVGLIFMPSGLAYFNGTQAGEAYSPLIFNVELLVSNTADHDRDGIPSFLEDRNSDANPLDEDADEDTIPDYLDIDDDNDGTLTIDEDLEPDTDLDVDRDGDGDPTNDIGDGNPLNDDTDGDGTPNYLDTDDTASRKDTN